MRIYPYSSAFFAFFIASSCAFAEEPAANYDEAKVPAYTLPDPLVLSNGNRVTDAATWKNARRPEIVSLFEKYVYGTMPSTMISDRPPGIAYKVQSVGKSLDGKANCKQVRIFLAAAESGPKVDVLVYTPAMAKGPVPAFIGLNFDGNYQVDDDPGITISETSQDRLRAAEANRGRDKHQWQVRKIIDRGYGLITACYGDIVPDNFEAWKKAVQSPPFAPKNAGDVAPGAVAMWAWGLSRIMDYIEHDSAIDARRVAVMGHSRLGKAALWAGASDQRFAMVISNDSGCGGASLARCRYGETVAHITRAFPHWFVPTYREYAGHLDDLPVDQHMVISLIAPRPVHIASAQDDRWADPHGEFLSAKAADPVYRLLGTDGLAAKEMPPPSDDRGQPVMSTIGYHIRRGKHDVTEYDWQCYLDFADRYLKP